ncbi:hypothetical protein NQ314_010387 [Rhamnusium bicolor]|uniref:Uncharacterized protein n=1 Tax=Rhamnusium bicolor TaxID=1586634 RepID=A0AAV8XR08_9CUCU|nr:hypothetical protein NQ314_010387 [Rhamnusium bicolor]
MEKAMVPPQTDSTIQHYSSSVYRNNIYSLSEEMIPEGSPKISIKLPEDLFEKSRDEAREIILASGTLPGELELRENGVFSKTNICKGTRYGPFQGKWASIPQDTRFAWELLQEVNGC